MSLPYDKSLKPLTRSLRSSMTDAERKLWSDFHCASAALVIELDGGQHYDEKGREKDAHRDADLAALGLTVLRFSDRDVMMNLAGVLETTRRACDRAQTPSIPLSKGGSR